MEKLPKALVSLRTERGRTALCLFVLCLFVLYLFILCLFVVVEHFGESTNCRNFQVPDVLADGTQIFLCPISIDINTTEWIPLQWDHLVVRLVVAIARSTLVRLKGQMKYNLVYSASNDTEMVEMV